MMGSSIASHASDNSDACRACEYGGGGDPPLCVAVFSPVR